MVDTGKAAEPLSPEQEKKVHAPADRWSDDFALKVATQDFLSASTFRHANHDWRWRNADEIYLAWQQQKVWPGTKTPRSSLPVFLAFQQIESMLPAIIGALFADAPAFFFADPLPGTSLEEARLVREVMISQLRNLTGQDGVHPGFRDHTRRCLKSGLIYGNGIGELGWLFEAIERIKFSQEFIPEFTTIDVPGFGPVQVPTGNTRREVKEQRITETVNQPFFRYCSLKDVYVDPNTPSPSIQEGRFAIKRVRFSIDDLEKLRKQDGFNIPSKDILIEMARQRPSDQGEQTKRYTESIRGNTWNPQNDTSVDPGAKTLEILGYQTRERNVWVLNRMQAIFNQPNPFGFISLFNTFYADVLDRFYSLAITDIVEGDQRLIAGLINAHNDEVSLTLNPERRKRRGVQIPSYALRRRPGGISEWEDPEKDLITEPGTTITKDVFQDVNFAERRVEKYTGATDIGVVGVGPGRFGNAAARTATGVNTQSQAAGVRIGYIIENAESSFVEPILNGWHKLNNLFLPTDQDMQIRNTDGQEETINPVDVKNANAKFTMRGSSRLRSRSALAQTFPLLSGVLFNNLTLELLAKQQGKTINIEEITNMVLEMTNYRPRQGIFRDLTDEEKQNMNQPSAEEQLRLQMQRERLASTEDQQGEQREADLVETVLAQVMKQLQEGGQEAGT